MGINTSFLVDVYCPDCGVYLLKQKKKYVCNQCGAEFEFKMVLVRVPTYKPIGFIYQDENDPYP